MSKNVGTVDRVIRIVLGLALIALVFVGPQTPWGWIGVIPLVTGFVSFCPAYRLLGVRTCKLTEA
jgi:membrane-associated protease RseP (regulator of RpoE activity)